MRPALALVVAVACAGLAVGVVATDLAFTLVVRLETLRVGGDWDVVAEHPYRESGHARFFTPACAAPQLRLVADNHRPLAANLDVEVTWANATAGPRTLYAAKWNLQPFELQFRAFNPPPEAFLPPPASSTSPEIRPSYGPGDVHVDARAGDAYLFTCVRPEA